MTNVVQFPSQRARGMALEQRIRITAGAPPAFPHGATNPLSVAPSPAPAVTFVRLGEAVVAVRRAA